MKKGPFKLKMKQYGQGKNPITKKSPAELGRLKGMFGGALSKLGLGRKKSSSSGRRGFGGGAIGALGNLGGVKRPLGGAALGLGSGGGTKGLGAMQIAKAIGSRPKNTVGRVAKGAINLFNRRR